jgi:hypothetical protein
MLSETGSKRKNDGTDSSIKEECKESKNMIYTSFDSINKKNRFSTIVDQNIKKNNRYGNLYSSLNPK